MEHRTTKPYTPQTNGLVERFNGRVQREVLGITIYSHRDLETLLKGASPEQVVQRHLAAKPELANMRFIITEFRRSKLRSAPTGSGVRGEGPTPSPATAASPVDAPATLVQIIIHHPSQSGVCDNWGTTQDNLETAACARDGLKLSLGKA